MVHGDSRKISPVGRAEWAKTTELFSRTNKGRSAKVERYGTGRAHEHMETGIPLLSLTYNPPDKGDSFTIALGQASTEREIRVEGPRELWVAPSLSAKGSVMEIIDREGSHVAIALE